MKLFHPKNEKLTRLFEEAEAEVKDEISKIEGKTLC